MPSYYYIVFGLRVITNQALAGLTQQPFEAQPDLCVEFLGPHGGEFSPTPATLLLNGVKRMGDKWHSLRVWQTEDSLEVRYQLNEAQVAFTLTTAGERVQVQWSPNFPTADIPAFFLGPVIGCILRLRGRTALHAGVVAVDNGAVAIIGDKGAGKSTLIGAFARAGFPILADDIAALVEDHHGYVVSPGYPRLRLWPETLDWLGVTWADLPIVESIFTKRYLDLTQDPNADSWRFGKQPLPLRAIYYLTPRQSVKAPEITSTTPSFALHTLLQNCYVDYILDQTQRLAQFQTLAKLVQQAPVRLLHRPDDLHVLPDCCAAIQQDVRLLHGHPMPQRPA